MTKKFEDEVKGITNMSEEEIRNMIRKNKQERIVEKSRRSSVKKDNSMERFLGAMDRLTKEQKEALIKDLKEMNK